MDDAFDFVTEQHAGLIAGLDDDTATRALDELRASMIAHTTVRGVYYDSAALLITAVRS